MVKQVWKFELETQDNNFIRMPKECEILSIQAQYERPCIWALVNPDSEQETRHFEIFGTGHDIHYDMGVSRKFIGTYQLSGGSFVGHVFERN